MRAFRSISIHSVLQVDIDTAVVLLFSVCFFSVLVSHRRNVSCCLMYVFFLFAVWLPLHEHNTNPETIFMTTDAIQHFFNTFFFPASLRSVLLRLFFIWLVRFILLLCFARVVVLFRPIHFATVYVCFWYTFSTVGGGSSPSGLNKKATIIYDEKSKNITMAIYLVAHERRKKNENQTKFEKKMQNQEQE